MLAKKPVSKSLLILLLLLNAGPGSYELGLGELGLLENISVKERVKSLLLAVNVLIIIKKYNKFYDNNDSLFIEGLLQVVI
jgi:hypothetical protein